MPTNAERLQKAVDQRKHPRINRMQSATAILNHQQQENERICRQQESLEDMSSHILPYLNTTAAANQNTRSTSAGTRISTCTNNSSNSSASSSASTSASSSVSTLSYNGSTNYTSPTINSSANSVKSPKRLFEKAEMKNESPQMVVAYNEDDESNDKTFMEFGNSGPSTPIPDDVGMFTNNNSSNNEFYSTESELFLPISVRALNLDLDNSIRDALITTVDNPHPQTSTTAVASNNTNTMNSMIPKQSLNEPINFDVSTIDRSGASIKKRTFGTKMKQFARSIAN